MQHPTDRRSPQRATGARPDSNPSPGAMGVLAWAFFNRHKHGDAGGGFVDLVSGLVFVLAVIAMFFYRDPVLAWAKGLIGW